MTNRELIIAFKNFVYKKDKRVIPTNYVDRFLASLHDKRQPTKTCFCGTEMDIIADGTPIIEPEGRWLTWKCPNCGNQTECLTK